MKQFQYTEIYYEESDNLKIANISVKAIYWGLFLSNEPKRPALY